MTDNHEWKFVSAGWDPKTQKKNEKRKSGIWDYTGAVFHLRTVWSLSN